MGLPKQETGTQRQTHKESAVRMGRQVGQAASSGARHLDGPPGAGRGARGSATLTASEETLPAYASSLGLPAPGL